MIGACLALAIAAAPPSPPVTVVAEEVQYLYKEGKVVFTGKPLVTLTREDATLTCRKLVAENDGAGAHPAGRLHRRRQARRGARGCTCETATYEETTARVTCTGNPVLKDGESVMRGEVLAYDLADDRATLTAAKGTIVPQPGIELAPRRKKEPAP